MLVMKCVQNILCKTKGKRGGGGGLTGWVIFDKDKDRLQEELDDEKLKHKKVKKEMKEVKKETEKLEKEIERLGKVEKGDATPKHTQGEFEVIKEECATLRGECKVLREDRNAWREECAKAKEDSKKWMDKCSEVEIECREVRLVHEEGVQLITSLRRDNELMRRDNELLWEQLDAWGALGHGLGLKGEKMTERQGEGDEEKKVHEEEVEVSPTSTRVMMDTQTQDATDGNGLDESHHFASSAPAGRMNPPPSPIPLRPSSSLSSQPRLYPTQPNADDSLDSSVDTQSVMFEAQALAHQRSATLILAQMEKLGGQLQALVHAARNTNTEQWTNNQAHTAHLHSQLSRVRDTTLRLRDVYDQDSQRLQEASLDALRSHLNGIKSVYNALSY